MILTIDGTATRVDMTGVASAEQANAILRRGGIVEVAVLTHKEAETASRQHEAAMAEAARLELGASLWRDVVRSKVRDGRWTEIKPDEQRWILSALEADCGGE
jgi:hypothetical protein